MGGTHPQWSGAAPKRPQTPFRAFMAEKLLARRHSDPSAKLMPCASPHAQLILSVKTVMGAKTLRFLHGELNLKTWVIYGPMPSVTSALPQLRLSTHSLVVNALRVNTLCGSGGSWPQRCQHSDYDCKPLLHTGK